MCLHPRSTHGRVPCRAPDGCVFEPQARTLRLTCNDPVHVTIGWMWFPDVGVIGGA
jgi:hypothetical protein